jgi:polyhydroxyalkanoate synthesis regulator phasin
MTTGPAADPFTFFREAVNQWEKAANDFGSKMLGSSQTAEMMHKGTAASMQVQNALKDGMNKALSAANMPSKADVEALGAQIGAVEARLARIEALLSGTAQATPVTPKPKRTRQPK